MPSLLLIFCCLVSLPLMADSELKPDLLASACAACHGTNGHAHGSMPPLAGMEQKAFISAMRDFQSGTRESAVMQRHALGYTEAELKILAEFFARQ